MEKRTTNGRYQDAHTHTRTHAHTNTYTHARTRTRILSVSNIYMCNSSLENIWDSKQFRSWKDCKRILWFCTMHCSI